MHDVLRDTMEHAMQSKTCPSLNYKAEKYCMTRQVLAFEEGRTQSVLCIHDGVKCTVTALDVPSKTWTFDDWAPIQRGRVKAVKRS